MDDIGEDLKTIGIKRWRKKVLERREWASVLREAKAKLEGL